MASAQYRGESLDDRGEGVPAPVACRLVTCYSWIEPTPASRRPRLTPEAKRGPYPICPTGRPSTVARASQPRPPSARFRAATVSERLPGPCTDCWSHSQHRWRHVQPHSIEYRPPLWSRQPGESVVHDCHRYELPALHSAPPHRHSKQRRVVRPPIEPVKDEVAKTVGDQTAAILLHFL